MGQFNVFLDSDVIVSALLSSKGASFEILHNTKVHKITSTTIEVEVLTVIKRQHIPASPKQVFQEMECIQLNLDKARLVKAYLPYVFDEADSHVVAGAHKADAKFLLTHNLKHYQVKEINRDFNILVMKPGMFLQYLRRKASS